MFGMSRKMILGAAAAIAMLFFVAAIELSHDGCFLPSDCTAIKRLPHIRPDYTEIVIPPNIAPLNFVVEEKGTEYRVRIHGKGVEDIIITSAAPSIIIPAQPWRNLLDRNRGGRIGVDIFVKGEGGRWSRFDSIENSVAEEKIDSHLVYRLIGPVCNDYRTVGIYQRNLETYDESPVVKNDSFGGCVNCHSFVNNRPDLFSFHVRPAGSGKKVESGMIAVRDGVAARVKIQSPVAPKPPSNPAWHPSGSAIVFSMTKTRQVFRGAGAELRDVVDFDSHMAMVNMKTGAVSTSSYFSDPDSLETFPCWSVDGKVLYFCRAKRLWDLDKAPAITDLDKIMYDLISLRFDIETNEWSDPKTVLSSRDTGLSICQPRVSPDGCRLLFCMLAYGCFPLYSSSSDLYLMDLKTGEYRRLSCNSDHSEAWHCWSNNSRWIVFSSKRDNPLMARPYFCYIDSEGKEHKPFILPQKNPTFYDSYLKTYNVPELVTGAVAVPPDELQRVIECEEVVPGKSVSSELPARASDGPNKNN